MASSFSATPEVLSEEISVLCSRPLHFQLFFGNVSKGISEMILGPNEILNYFDEDEFDYIVIISFCSRMHNIDEVYKSLIFKKRST